MRHEAGSALGDALRPPQLNRHLVERPRLVAQLDAATQHALTVMVAPAGWGKTVLAAQWASHHVGAVAWLAFEPRHTAASVATLLAGAVAMLTGTEPVPATDATSLTPEFERALLDDFADLPVSYLVMAGVDRLEPKVRDVLGRLIEAAPSSVHVVVTTRGDVLFHATIARLEMTGDIAFVRRADLNFDLAETRAVLAQEAGAVDDADVERALELTGGWPAATRMLAYALRASDDPNRVIAGFTGHDTHLRDYFASEVLAELPGPLRAFALETSAPDRVTPELCRALTDRDDSSARLDLLERHDLVERDGGHRNWWRYPPLVRDLLRAELRDANPASEAHLLRVAAEWHLDRGTLTDIEAAAQYAIRAQHWDLVHALVRRYGRRLHESAHVTTVLQWILAVPEPVRRADAGYTALEAAVLTLAGHPMQAEQVVRSLHDTHHVSPGREIALSAIRSVWVDDHLSPQQVYEATDVVMEGLRTVAREDFRPLGDIVTAQNVATIAAVTRARASWYLNDVSAARRGLFQELEGGDTSPLSRLHLFGALALIESWNGTLTIGEHFAVQARELAADSLSSAHPYLVPSELALAHIFIEQQSFDDAVIALERVDALTQVVTHSAWKSMLAFERAWLALARHAPHDGLAALAHVTTESPPRPLFEARRRSLTARLYLALDDVNRAERELAYDPATATGTIAGVAVQLALLRDDLRRAQAVLDTWPEARAEQDRLQHCLWTAIVALAGGDRSGGLDAAEEAVDLASVGRHVRAFLDAGPVAHALLDIAARHDTTGYLSSVVLPELRPAPQGDVVESSTLLTPRELAVLRQLADRFSYAEISEALFISQNTVKTHAKSIYMKLGASGRRDAVRRAEQLGLL